MKSKLKFIIPILIVIITFVIYQIFFKNKTTSPTYSTGSVDKGTLISTVTSSGKIAATNSRIVTTTASGVVKKVFVTEGQKVVVGTPIMSIDLDLDGLQKYKSALASYQSAQNNLKSTQDRIYSLQSAYVQANNIFTNQWANQSPDDVTYIQKHNDLLTAKANLDNLETSILQSQASLESARISYQQASPTVYAPISGTVSAISLTTGMILNPTSNTSSSSNTANNIAIVKTNTTPAVSVSLTEIDVSKVKVGAKATITLDAFTDKTFTGKVIAIDTSGSVSSGVVSYPTTIQFDTDVPEILSNMSASATIITKIKNDVLLIPSSAIVTNNGSTTVRQLVNKQLIYTPVVVGDSDNTNTEITSGLNEGDSIVTNVTTATTTKTSTTGTSVFGNTRVGGFGPGR
jgi:RND family efflux transporter MFP subunit